MFVHVQTCLDPFGTFVGLRSPFGAQVTIVEGLGLLMSGRYSPQTVSWELDFVQVIFKTNPKRKITLYFQIMCHESV